MFYKNIYSFFFFNNFKKYKIKNLEKHFLIFKKFITFKKSLSSYFLSLLYKNFFSYKIILNNFIDYNIFYHNYVYFFLEKKFFLYIKIYNLIFFKKLNLNNFKKVLIFSLNFRNTKPFYSIFLKQKKIFGITLGIFLKKLSLKKKSLKKSNKINLILIKILLKRLVMWSKIFNKILIILLGLKKFLIKILFFLKVKMNYPIFWLIHSPLFYRNSLKVKKLRSIKKKFKKKFINH